DQSRQAAAEKATEYRAPHHHERREKAERAENEVQPTEDLHVSGHDALHVRLVTAIRWLSMLPPIRYPPVLLLRAPRRPRASFHWERRNQFLSRRFRMKLLGRRSARPAADGYSVIDDQLSVSGDIQTEGTIRVDGRVEGTLHRVDTLIIGSGGKVVGNIEAREVVI